MQCADLDLLKVKFLGGSQTRDRVQGLAGFVFVGTDDAHTLWVGSEVPRACVDVLLSLPAESTAILARGEAALQELGWTTQRSVDVIYVFQHEVRVQVDATIHRSGTADLTALRQGNPGNWHPVEWQELLDGALGPWVMSTIGARVVSICHTPLPMRPDFAECGVWTHPDFRGRGHAACVTAEWATLLRPSGRHLFYSTRDDNHSSQRVAGRLGLRKVGWARTVLRVPPTPPSSLHPLSKAR